jgi:hypothetical protein
MAEEFSLASHFQKKYVEFANDLRGAFPELEESIAKALALEKETYAAEFKKFVFRKHAVPKADLACPGPVLPGVVVEEASWKEVSAATKKAVYDYLSILDLCCMYDGDFSDLSGEGFDMAWAEKVMKDWRSRMSGVDFKGLSEKFFSLFGSNSSNLPPLPERFLKGKLAKLAEDMVREFNPEDFGLSKSDLEAIERDPTRAFEILMQASALNPNLLQKAMGRVAKKLQEKVARGELRPQELAAEAEEMMKEFQSNPAFVEMMESFRSAFSFEDPDLARQAGRDGDSRLAVARARLRKKLDAKKGGKK